MPADPLPSTLYVEGRQRTSADASSNWKDRRKRVRARLHLPVCFFAAEHRAAVETTTRDLSINGFYCVSPAPFRVNEIALCFISIPICRPDRAEQTLVLKCRARIVRVELLEGTGYGAGCEIEDYCFLKDVEVDAT